MIIQVYKISVCLHFDVGSIHFFSAFLYSWGYSSVVEHSTADREVPGSNPGVPSNFLQLLTTRLTELTFDTSAMRNIKNREN